MSFSSISLGQGIRLDHHNLSENHPPSPRSFGASTTNTHANAPALTDLSDPNEPALARFARLKQREQALNPRPAKSTFFTSPPKPEKWSVKDTSVNIATAFHQAAATAYDMQPNNPNTSWASGRPVQTVPRSTSVEYEKEAAARRQAALALPKPNSRRKPLSKTTSMRLVPDSEGEDGPETANGRGKSPFEHVIDMTRRALSPAAFYLRQRSHEPENLQRQANGDESSYDYAAEEAEYQSIINQGPHARRGATTAHKRNRMSLDNKAYRPTASDLEDEDEDFDNPGKLRRRKKKKEPLGGPLTTLPSVANFEKKKRRRPRGSKGNLGEMDDDERSDSDDNAEDHVEATAAERASVLGEPPPVSVRGSVLPQHGFNDRPQDLSGEGLESIPEIPEPPTHQHPILHVSPPPSINISRPSFSIGAVLGKIARGIYLVFSALFHVLFAVLGMLLFLLGNAFGTAYEVLSRPALWLRGLHSRTFIQLGKYLLIAIIIYAVWYLQEPLLHLVPSRPWIRSTPYRAPHVPPANIAELSARLQTIEIALSGLAQQHIDARTRLESEEHGRTELGGRVGSIEARLQLERTRVSEAEAQLRQLISLGLPSVKQDLEALLATVNAQATRDFSQSDEEARARVKALEKRVDGVEGGLKEALEVGQNAIKAGGTAGAAAAWWNKLATDSATGAELTIKSSDGRDVTALIGHLVDTAVSKYGKDVIARPDFALHSSGARIIPSLTSPTFETSPPTFRGQIVGLFTGNGYAIGRPPITALHHELHGGHCWPFAGSKGQLGVALAAPTYISDVTIDHVAKEVAFDMRSAPREMEVWGMVEGRDNLARVQKWREEKARARAAGGQQEEEPEYPRTLPRSPPYIRLASFSYDVHSPHHIQTFPVLPEIRDLDVDFGVVVLMVKSNWGRADYTCLYRLRVHGERMGENPPPSAADSP